MGERQGISLLSLRATLEVLINLLIKHADVAKSNSGSSRLSELSIQVEGPTVRAKCTVRMCNQMSLVQVCCLKVSQESV